MKNWKKYRNLLFTSVMLLIAAVGTAAQYRVKDAKQAQKILTDVTEDDYEPGTERGFKNEADVKPRVALTFDDGPHSVYTEKLLDGLRDRGVKATFFLVGKNIPGKEETVRQMDEDGHLIGNHTYDHIKITGVSEVEACLQLTKTSELVKAITGKDTEYVRPPFGEWNKEIECGITMFPVLWTIDPLDWTTANTDLVVDRVVKKVKEDDIILLHDIFESSVDAALRIVDLLQAEGYEFVTADQLILE